MMNAAVYETATGRVVQVMSVREGDLDGYYPGDGRATLVAPDGFDALVHYVEDGQFVAMPARPSLNHVFDYATKQWVDPRTLDDLKAQKWREIRGARDAAEFGGFVWGGSTFDSDAMSQSRIMGAAQLAQMNPGFTIDWTLADNAVRSLSAADMIAVGVALGQHVATQHATARTLRAQIQAATTASEVNAVAWPE